MTKREGCDDLRSGYASAAPISELNGWNNTTHQTTTKRASSGCEPSEDGHHLPRALRVICFRDLGFLKSGHNPCVRCATGCARSQWGNSLLYLLGNAAHSSVVWFAHVCGVYAVQFSTTTAPGPSRKTSYLDIYTCGSSRNFQEVAWNGY